MPMPRPSQPFERRATALERLFESFPALPFLLNGEEERDASRAVRWHAGVTLPTRARPKPHANLPHA